MKKLLGFLLRGGEGYKHVTVWQMELDADSFDVKRVPVDLEELEKRTEENKDVAHVKLITSYVRMANATNGY